MIAPSIGWRDIESYSNLTGDYLQHWEADFMIILSSRYVHIMSGDGKADKEVVVRDRVPITDGAGLKALMRRLGKKKDNAANPKN